MVFPTIYNLPYNLTKYILTINNLPYTKFKLFKMTILNFNSGFSHIFLWKSTTSPLNSMFFLFPTLSIFSPEKALQVQGLCAGAGDPTKNRISEKKGEKVPRTWWFSFNGLVGPKNLHRKASIFIKKRGAFLQTFPKKTIHWFHPFCSKLFWLLTFLTLPIRIPKFR